MQYSKLKIHLSRAKEKALLNHLRSIIIIQCSNYRSLDHDR